MQKTSFGQSVKNWWAHWKPYKQEGKKAFHRQYLFLMFLCLILSVFGSEGGRSIRLLKSGNAVQEASNQGVLSVLSSSDVYVDIVNGDLGKGLQTSNQIIENISETIGGHAALGRTKGVLAGLVNSVSAGRLHLKIAHVLRRFTDSDQAAGVLFILLDILRITLVWIFIRNVYSAIVRRAFLEARVYDKMPFTDVLHFAVVRRWFKASWTMFVKEFFFYLWSLTIVGGFIKYYSYYAVPYIVAENPSIGPLEAITLSRRMMNGHKKEAFLFDLSYIGWYLLEIVTLGLSDLFYGLPYRIAGRSEYYAALRAKAKEQQIPLAEKLDDTYLFEKADKILLYETYFDVVDRQTYVHEHAIRLSPARAFFSKWLGLWIGTLEEKKTYEELEGIKFQMYFDEKRRDGRVYPTRLNPRYKERRIRLHTPFNFLRSYSIWTIALLFILFSVIGWTWEVSLHLAQGDGFINRGMLHGPWLPIYGMGGIVALMLCSRFRKHPLQEFFVSVALCGGIEYLGAYILETRYHEKWWSYEGAFLNIHGRVCAEGLLVFGIACMIVVYLLAPVFDYVISHFKKKTLVLLAVCLIGIFAADLGYSSVHPNMAKGAIEAHDTDQ